MQVAARAYKGRTSLLRVVGNLQVTPVLTQDGRYLPEVTISKKDCRARPSTYSPAVFTKDGRRGRPSLPTRTGRLGTLVVFVKLHPDLLLQVSFLFGEQGVLDFKVVVAEP